MINYDTLNANNEILVGRSFLDTPGFSLGSFNFNLQAVHH
jgi:hypothetical protein